MMRLVRPFFLAVTAIALATYAFDCGATTMEQAMQCCDSMPCSSGGHHGRECCKTMQAMHAAFVQPPSVHGVSYPRLVFAVIPVTGESHSQDSSDRVIAAHCHAPPILYAAAPLPLRV
jgi:hypothetical protein